MSVVEPRVADFSQYGTVLRPEDFDISWSEFYRGGDEQTEQLRRSYRAEVGIVYGTEPSHILDLYLPNTGDSIPGVFAFLHGGAFREGHPAHYGFLARPYLEAGFAFASIGYRLVPAVSFPDTTEDVVAAIAWLNRRLGDYGVNPAGIILGGHSAGAMMTALLGVRHDWQATAGLAADALKGLVLVSGYYDFREEFPGNHVVDPDKRVPASAICHIDTRVQPPPSVISYGPAELNWKQQILGQYATSSNELATALAASGAMVDLVPLPGANHDDTAAAIADPDSPLALAILGLMRLVL